MRYNIASIYESWNQIEFKILHALGFYHEHQRPDRDNFLKVDWSSVKSGTRKSVEHQIKIIPDRFWKIKSSDEYDYKSIMHYNSDLG